MIACGLDFGTSNSAVGIVVDGRPRLVPVEGDSTLIPSAIFFGEGGGPLFGTEAIATHVGGTTGRLMRALKTILGSSLIDERTTIGKRRMALTDVVELFIRHLKAKAEACRGVEIDAVVHGRPVRFVDGNDAADARAQATLDGIARRAGFKDVVFVPEPIAAAYAYEETAVAEEVVLVADIGGGTSDFSVIRIGPDRRGRMDRTADILASTGVRVGGTDLDTALSLDAVMPLLGKGSTLVDRDLPVPNGIFFNLATWATINFVYTPRNERETRAMARDAREPEKLARLHRAVRDRLGHRIAFAVEAAKLKLSEAPQTGIDLDFLEAGLAAEADRDAFERAIADQTDRVRRTALACIANAGLTPSAIGTIFFTGGSSRVPAVRAAIASVAPQAAPVTGSDFLSVAAGLTREAANRFGG